MKVQEKKRYVWIIAVIVSVIILMLFIMGSKVFADYWRNYFSAEGGILFTKIISNTELEEETYNLEKHIVVTAGLEGMGIFARVKVFAPADVTYIGEGWSYNETDGYYYYELPLMPGESSKELVISIQQKEQVDFDVVVIQEATPIKYKDNGQEYANWNAKYLISE